MISLGLGLGLSSAAPATGYPSTLTLTGWWRASYSGIPWVGTTSLGASGSRNLDDASSGLAPSTGTAVNGLTPATYPAATRKLLSSALNWSSFVGANFTMFTLVKCATLHADGASPTAEPALTVDASDSVALSVSASGARSFIFDGASKVTAYVPVTTGAWHLVSIRLSGGLLYTGVDGTWSTGVASGAVSGGGGLFRVGYNNSSINLDGDILEVIAAASDLSGNYTSIRDYVNARYGLAIA